MKTDTEKSLEASGKIPRIVQVMYFKEAPRPSANQQPEQSLPQVWEAQWQQFLKTVQHSHAGWGNPQLTDAVPWDDTKAFLAAFEQVAEACRWPREEWVARLLPALRGGMEQIYCRLDARERGDYGKVKSALLRGDAIRTESKRQHFRQCCYQEFEGPRRIYGHLQDLCRQWLKPEHRTKEQILELIIQEQLLAMLPPEVQNRVRECAPEDCVEVVALAEDFLMGRRATKMWEWPVPLQRIAVNSLDAEGPLTDGTARQRYTASERMSTRNNGFMLPPEKRETSGAGLTEGLANLKDRSVALQTGGWTSVNVDQKPLHWELAQGNYGNVGSSDDLLIPTPDISQPNQEGVLFTHITETGETIPGIVPAESRILSEIKIESYEDADSEAEGSFDALTEDSQDAVPTSPEMCEESPRRKLRPREPPGGKQGGSMPQSTSVQLRERKSTLVTDKKQKEKKHQCTECGHRTYYLSDLLRHMNTHNGKRPYRCPECGKTFSKLTSFETHKKGHVPPSRLKPGRKPLNRQGEGNHINSRCGKRVAAASALARPVDDNVGDKPFQCQDCGQSFRWMSSLCRHWRIRGCRRNTSHLRRGGLQEIKHRGCSERIESKAGLTMLLEESPGAFSRAPRACKLTPASSRLRPRKPPGDTPGASEAKSSEIQDKRKHVCPDCGKRCAKIQDLIEHVRIHTGEKPYECPKCGRTFRWSSNFLAHQRKCHVKRPAPRTPLPEHLETNAGDEQPCKVKQEEIKTEDQYGTWPEESPGAISSEASENQGGGKEEPTPPSRSTVSVKKPTGYTRKKRYPCLQCGRKFLRLSNMLLHTRVHGEEKPYECFDCGKTFRWASNLSEHQKSHECDRKEPESNPGLAECDVILEDEEELIHILERNFQKGGTKSEDLPEESQDAASDSTEDCETRAISKLRAGRPRGVSARCLKTAAATKKNKYGQKERKHKCNVCGHRTFYLSDLLRHMRVHSRERPYKCLGCGKAFTQNSALLFHQRRDSCGPGSGGRKGLAKGIATRKGGRNLRGKKRTYKLAGLVKGKQSYSEKEKPFVCEECGQSFTWSSNLCRHRKLHRNDSDASLTESHKMDAGSSKPNKMTVENSPQARATLKRMGGTSAEITPGVASVTVVINDGGWKSKSQPGKKPATGNLGPKGAAQAGRSLYSKSGTAYHYTNGLVTAQKTPTKKKHQCKVCNKSFSIKCHLIDHENSHTGAKPYECNECGRRFAWKAKLYRHQKTHTGVKSYQCPECDKSFYRKDNLMRHLKSHGSSCAYQCLQCGRRFSERDQLFRHQKSHAGLYPYECGECGQGFSQEDIWIRHQQKHTGKK